MDLTDTFSEKSLLKFIDFSEKLLILFLIREALAFQLISDLCGNDEQKWKDVEETAIECLIAREKLWDAIFEEIQIKH